jgi:hypothetical protein
MVGRAEFRGIIDPAFALIAGLFGGCLAAVAFEKKASHSQANSAAEGIAP